MPNEMDAAQWAEQQFGHCQLGDKRRSRRLVQVATALAQNGGGNLCAATRGFEAAKEAAYRLIRNPSVNAEAIMEAGFEVTAQRVASCQCLLAIDDTTSLSYTHSVRESLGDIGPRPDVSTRGYLVHSTLLVDAERGTTEGLIAQTFWCRDEAERGQRHQRKQRCYAEKESYKWQHHAELMRQRLADKMVDVIAVSDRESDIYEYLLDKVQHGERFIVRAAQDRRLSESDERLSEALSDAPKYGESRVEVSQRGGRPACQATLSLRAVQVELAPPKTDTDHRESLRVNVVWACEESASKDALNWVLLTSESIADEQKIQEILHHYRRRWRIEDFHKAWKSGCGVEQQRQQSADNLQRMAVIMGFVAVRLLQLREVLDNTTIAELPCTQVLSEVEWKVLWATSHPAKPLPRQTPTLHWAYQYIAKLGGFYDSKRTGRASWATIHLGLTRLDERVQGFNLLRSLDIAAVSGPKM